MKRCSRCGATKPIADFSKGGRSSGGRVRLHSYCRPCNVASAREWRLANPERERSRKRRQRLRRYGLTEAQYDALLAAQGGKCAICSMVATFHVDHDHTTGAVRGILCETCNIGLGVFRDNANSLANAIAYLEASRATA